MKKKTLWRDPIVEEIHRFREEYAKKFDHDPEKMYQDLKRLEQELEQENDGPYVTLEDGKLAPVDSKDQTAWYDPVVEEVRKRGQDRSFIEASQYRCRGRSLFSHIAMCRISREGRWHGHQSSS